ncbi:MAG: hypothetical protein GF410_02465, partial [Chitinivibrionales bacterium]|nr:hypothetical protein [Chitinivibrionales bacterium]
MSIRAAYVFNHEDIVGGGEVSGIELVDAVRAHAVSPVAFVPGEGEVTAR